MSTTSHHDSAVIHAIGLSPQTAIPVMDAAEVEQLGFRQYPSLDNLLETLPPSAVGCVVICPGQDQQAAITLMRRLREYFYSISIVGLIDSSHADSAVDLMQEGAFSVLTIPLDHQRLSRTLNGAVNFSSERQGTLDASREATLRMNAATEKEREVLQLIMNGRKNKEIAAELGITIRAVEDRRFRLMKKVRVDSVAELVALAVTAKFHEQGITATPTRSVAGPAAPTKAVKALEVWIPDEQNNRLRLAASCYRDADAMRDPSQEMAFCRGEGLPGRIWEAGAPAFLDELITTDFVRAAEASAAGINTAVGFPVFCDEQVAAVVLILLDSRQDFKAAFESWRIDPQTSNLRLAGGTFINCERLRRLTEFVELPVGEGLPGFAAEQARPYVSARFPDDGHAVRGLALAAEQLSSGLALPLTGTGAVVSDVFLILNSDTAPVFSLLQIWKPTPDGRLLRLSHEIYDGVTSLSAQTSKVTATTVTALARRAWETRLPTVSQDGLAAEMIPHSTHIPDPSFGIAIPTIIRGRVVAVTVLAN